jgi:BCD family chlorophyll transporter-like MFS transporter
VTVILNGVALWKQEARDPTRRPRADAPAPAFAERWSSFIALPRSRRFLWAVGLGTAAFSMQDVVLEPYGGEILHLGVGATSALTAVYAAGSLAAFIWAARLLGRGGDPCRVAALGALLGLPAFAAVVFAAPMEAPGLFRAGTALIGFGAGLFAVGTLTEAMNLERPSHIGLALGAWGAVQASAGGLAVAAGGAMRDLMSSLARQGALGPALIDPVTGYSFVYHVELALLFFTLVALGPLVRPWGRRAGETARQPFGLADFPG